MNVFFTLMQVFITASVEN